MVWEGFEVGSDTVKPFASVRKSRRSLFCVHSYYCRWRASVPPPSTRTKGFNEIHWTPFFFCEINDLDPMMSKRIPLQPTSVGGTVGGINRGNGRFLPLVPPLPSEGGSY